MFVAEKAQNSQNYQHIWFQSKELEYRKLPCLTLGAQFHLVEVCELIQSTQNIDINLVSVLVWN